MGVCYRMSIGARRVAWSILLALGARDSSSNLGGPIQTIETRRGKIEKQVIQVTKNELQEYIFLQETENLSKI